ncbi:beta-N-acetylhexosaminidase [Hymenobacter aerilatus]|uniref:Beta-N-acetylhexosaminidase n=1 Tax=Hymenobacter aerilatus TaxID=2932251 RepID=A0A8T9SYD7_9BACT|nr:family 20 glycosylhydrolase [Hymenobacter aerilatus]UOR05743.1 beta-N-acetylhexosaminidase [Hymenobacter aerilatus]
MLSFSRCGLIFLSLLLSAVASQAQLAPTPPTHQLMPVPATATWGAARIPLRNTFSYHITADTQPDTAVAAAARRVQTRLLRQLGVTRPPAKAKPAANQTPPTLSIRYGKPGRMANGDEERYALRVTPMGISLTAPTSLGALRGLATLEQLVTKDKNALYFSEVDIQDQPRFGWRGLLIDAARHFMPVPLIKRNLDAMAAVKLNVLHWHLSDDQGFRVESQRLPRLAQVGGEGQFYTQAQVREVQRYAAARGIRVVPEFDMPGHATAWLAAYPELASNDSTYGVATRWGVLNIAMDPTRETTYTLIDTLLGEMTQLFSDPYFHIGGDENDGRQWLRNPRIVQFMKEQKLVKSNGQPDKHALQTYFNRRILAMLTKYNKKMVGWDEILGPGLPESAVIQSWRGKKGLYDAVKTNHTAILSNGYYIDLNYSAASHYAVDPLPADAPLTEAQKKLVLGGEATMWAEFADSVIVDSRIWPRTAAIAERFWSPATVTDVPDMYRRLALVSAQLERLGIRHRRVPEQLLRQLAAGQPVAPLRTFASVLEPVKEYKRHFQGMKYTTQTPLNRLVDAAPAESDAAREFSAAVDALLAQVGTTPASPLPAALPALAAVRAPLTQWQANDVKLQLLFNTSASLREYGPLSARLSALSALALERLQLLEQGQTPTAAWKKAAQQQLEAAKAPAGQAELAMLPALQRLLNGLP